MQLMKAAETLDLGDIIEFVRQALEYVSEHPEVTNKDQYLLRIQLSKAAADLLGLLQESKEFYPGVGYDYAPDYPFIIEKNEDKVNLYILGVRTTKFFFSEIQRRWRRLCCWRCWWFTWTKFIEHKKTKDF